MDHGHGFWPKKTIIENNKIFRMLKQEGLIEDYVDIYPINLFSFPVSPMIRVSPVYKHLPMTTMNL